MLKVGDKVPAFSLNDQSGNTITNESLLGQNYVIYFYPKDDTPGCTKQACSVRDNYTKIENENYKVFGVSPDKEAKHVKFIDKYELNFSLLADPEKELINAFGAWGEKKFMGKIITGVLRSTFVIDEQGTIKAVIDKVKTKEHGQEILDAIAGI